MPWLKLDDQWMDHPKIIRAGRDARDMWLASLTYCARHLTDGYFSENLLPQLAVMAGVDVANCQMLASVLLEACLWERTEKGYHIHDYSDYNPSKEQAEATKKARSEAGRAGGMAKASKSASKPVAKSKQKSAPSPSPINSSKEESPQPFTLAVAIADVCKMDLEANKGRLLKEAQQLVKAQPTPTPDTIRENYGGNGCWWYRQDWRGKNGEAPSPAAIRETWGKWSQPKTDSFQPSEHY